MELGLGRLGRGGGRGGAGRGRGEWLSRRALLVSCRSQVSSASACFQAEAPFLGSLAALRVGGLG